MDAKKKTDQQEDEFKIRSKVECLYMFLLQLYQEQMQHILDVNFWQKRILKESNPATLKNLELELNKYKEEKKDIDTRIRITKSIIEEEKSKLSQQELTEVLEKVKLPSSQDMVKKTIDFFVMSQIPYEVNYKFWQSRLLEQTQPEVKASIEANILPSLKQSMELTKGGKENAEAYLETLKKEEKDSHNEMTN